jgi:hypothetical protein
MTPISLKLTPLYLTLLLHKYPLLKFLKKLVDYLPLS